MLISPLMDLLVVAGSGFLLVGSVLKAIDVATRYSPQILGFSSLDFLLMVWVCWGLALVLAARTWVQLNEPELLRQRRERLQREAAWREEQQQFAEENAAREAAEASEPAAEEG